MADEGLAIFRQFLETHQPCWAPWGAVKGNKLVIRYYPAQFSHHVGDKPGFCEVAWPKEGGKMNYMETALLRPRDSREVPPGSDNWVDDPPPKDVPSEAAFQATYDLSMFKCDQETRKRTAD
eukprot:CAMPEP_0119263286 /NCGR_PEP_ID=MMETSP1329-20130426/2739_1 /TAXON_ID=114041 /ORGANISM="Genus nov. species nov., Strain RCC1024" /LENGTH=121 /DNA_ID=CAMNT_0007262987 /DNA_START=203 /DNA_END=565 /DNA_ORIENTATION=+